MEGTTMSDMRRMMMMFTRPVESSSDTVPNPTISPSAGAILPTQTISISISGIATSAEYSFDNQTWTTYSSPFTLSSATTVYARATDGNGNYSEVVSNAYTILPYDAQVEYLEGTGAQWLNTGIVSTVNDTVSITLSTSNFNNSFLCGSRRNSSGMYDSFFIYAKVSEKVAFASNNGYTTSSVNVQDGQIHTIEHKADGGYIDGTKVVSRTFSAAPSSRSYTIFTVNDRDNPTNIVSCKLYGFVYNRSGIPIMELVPVRVGQVGYMYDKVSGELFGNVGSGSFTYGNDVTT